MRRNNQLAIKNANNLVGFAHVPYATVGDLLWNIGLNVMLNYPSEKDENNKDHFSWKKAFEITQVSTLSTFFNTPVTATLFYKASGYYTVGIVGAIGGVYLSSTELFSTIVWSFVWSGGSNKSISTNFLGASGFMMGVKTYQDLKDVTIYDAALSAYDVTTSALAYIGELFNNAE